MEERKQRSERDGKDVAEERSEASFTCNGDDCLITERAEEMFNLSCDPLRITLAELRQKVRCRRCAEKIASKRNKRVGEPGCGVYPLGQTLRTRERGAGAVPAAADAQMFVCAQDACGSQGNAQEMYNLQASLSVTEVEALLPLIRCRKHALEAAATKGHALCEPGSGVYRLSHTFKRLGIGPARSFQEAQDNDYLKWVLDTKAKREREEREARIRAYAVAYAESSIVDEKDGTVPRPIVRGEDGQLFCGIPLDCCRRDEPVHRFMPVMGEVVGICDQSARVFVEVHRDHEEKHGEDRRYRKLLSTSDFAQAQDIADRWSGGSDGDGHRRGSRSGRG
ncbi:MAG TPA: hypothetical protein VL426_06055 [Candidatus Binatia bacterium]|jgi:hypothetical protein|nr:hypothetical protein [Candidatus Binatia bacterium]